MNETNRYARTRVLFVLLMLALTALLAQFIATPLPALAQGGAPAPAPLHANTTPALVSLILLVIGLVAVGIVAVNVTGLPVPGSRSKASTIPEDDDLIQDE